MYDAVEGSFKIIIVVTIGDGATGYHSSRSAIIVLCLCINEILGSVILETMNIIRNV